MTPTLSQLMMNDMVSSSSITTIGVSSLMELMAPDENLFPFDHALMQS